MYGRWSSLVSAIMLSIAVAFLLAGCTVFTTVGKATIETPATVGSIGSHIRAKRDILNRQDFQAAIGYLAGTRYTYRQHMYAGDTDWWTINWAASSIVIKGHTEGKDVPTDVLYKAYRIKTDSHDLAESEYYLNLLRQKLIADFGEGSQQVLQDSLNPKRLLLDYLRAGGYIDFNYSFHPDIYDLLDLQEKGYQETGMNMPLLFEFPLRMLPAEREAFFRMIQFPLPESQWHEEAAIRQVMNTPRYLVALNDSYYIAAEKRTSSVLWELGRAISELNSAVSICVARHQGLALTPGQNMDLRLVEPPECLKAFQGN